MGLVNTTHSFALWALPLLVMNAECAQPIYRAVHGRTDSTLPHHTHLHTTMYTQTQEPTSARAGGAWEHNVGRNTEQRTTDSIT